MATISFRVPDRLKEKMDEYDEINWSAILRQHLEEDLDQMAQRNVARAATTSEQISQQINSDQVAEQNTANVIRAFREARYGPETES